jgi:7,8-dihydropterin-6-yl-methyl-4-(beta-D-ribofuranosyl)aminobenzene 5'-phosphate synthase
MQIKLLAEGSAKWERFIKHWGISFLIGDDVLFDTFGDAKVFWRNLKGSGIDPDKIRHIIISHDHWDHLAGLWPFLEKYKNVTVYICPGFSRGTKEKIAALGARLVEAAGPLEIKKSIYSTGPIRGVYAGQDIYEQAMIIKTARGVAIITGCAHPGISAIADEVKRHFSEPLFLIAGGFHLKKATRETIDNMIRALKAIGVKKVSPLHCTGALAQAVFKRAWGRDYIGLTAGKVLELEPGEEGEFFI